MARIAVRLNDAIMFGGLAKWVEHLVPTQRPDSLCAPFSTLWMQLVPQ